jgi:hypothetical protein
LVLRLAGFFIGFFFHPEGGDSTFFQNVGGFLPDYAALHP